MNRQGLVAVAVIAAVVLAVGLFLRRGAGKVPEPDSSGRVFVDDSLGVRLRIPESPGWILRRPAPNAEGLVAAAVHESNRATVRVLAPPLAAGDDLDTVLQRRKDQFARVFGASNLDDVVDRVMKDEFQEISGRPSRQWQAITVPVDVPGSEPETVMFLWILILQTERSIECLGLVRSPAAPDSAAMARSDALLSDVVYVMQSFEFR